MDIEELECPNCYALIDCSECEKYEIVKCVSCSKHYEYTPTELIEVSDD